MNSNEPHKVASEEWKSNIFCISLGPGDPELITLKALRLLKVADRIYCPATKMGERAVSRAYDMLKEVDIDLSKVYRFYLPMNKDRSHAQKVYNDVAREIAQMHNQRHSVAFVAEGDAGFYSSVHYISECLLQMNIAVDYVAGVPAFIACGALARLGIVKQEERLMVIPDGVTPETIAAQTNQGNVCVLMKLSQQENAIKQSMALLPNTEFHYFENVGVAAKEFYTNNRDEVLTRTFPYFSIMIIRNR